MFGNALPMELRSYRSVRDLETGGGVLRGGHLIARVDEQEGGTDPALTEFDVPSSQRLLHLNVEAMQPGSVLGRALGAAVAAAQNYLVEDSNGRQYKFIGKYALAEVNGVRTLEIQYFPDQVGTIGGVGAFSRIKEKDLQSGDQLVLLFLVEPGAEIVAFSTGDAARKEDLRSQILVAPK